MGKLRASVPRVLMVIVLLLLATTLTVTQARAAPTELIQNGGFETGDLPPWQSLPGPVSYTVQSDVVNSGSYAMEAQNQGYAPGAGLLTQASSTGPPVDTADTFSASIYFAEPSAPSAASFVIEVYNATSQVQLYYTLETSISIIYDNSSSTASYVFANEPVSTWISFTRNVAGDLSAAGFNASSLHYEDRGGDNVITAITNEGGQGQSTQYFDDVSLQAYGSTTVTMAISCNLTGGTPGSGPGFGSPDSGPWFNYVAGGVSGHVLLTDCGYDEHSVEFDPGSTWTLSLTSGGSASLLLPGSGSSEQWVTTSDAGAASPGTYVFTYDHQYCLTMAAGLGGTVSPATGWQEGSATVVINATASSGYGFAHWNGTGSGSYTGTDNPATAYMGSAINETATFTATPQFKIVMTSYRTLANSTEEVKVRLNYHNQYSQPITTGATIAELVMNDSGPPTPVEIVSSSPISVGAGQDGYFTVDFVFSSQPLTTGHYQVWFFLWNHLPSEGGTWEAYMTKVTVEVTAT